MVSGPILIILSTEESMRRFVAKPNHITSVLGPYSYLVGGALTRTAITHALYWRACHGIAKTPKKNFHSTWQLVQKIIMHNLIRTHPYNIGLFTIRCNNHTKVSSTQFQYILLIQLSISCIMKYVRAVCTKAGQTALHVMPWAAVSRATPFK